MARLNGGPHDGLDVSGICGDEEHFFVYDKRIGETRKFHYYGRSRDQAIGGCDFRAIPEPPTGALGKMLVIGEFPKPEVDELHA